MTSIPGLDIRIHTQKPCPQCDMTKRILTRDVHLPYTEIPLTDESRDKFRQAGHVSAHVVEATWNGETEVWAGFRPDRIRALIDAVYQDHATHPVRKPLPRVADADAA